MAKPVHSPSPELRKQDGVPAVELRGIHKRFGAVQANAGIDLQIWPGTIHALVGENGAGKSTAMKILYGMVRPDSGEVFINGELCEFRSPRDAMACGVGMVHQHFMLAGPCSALENIILGSEPVRWGMLDRKTARLRVEVLCRQYGLQLDLDQTTESMPVGLQQRVEILKLLFRDARVLVLDEPTGVLTPEESEQLFENLARLRDEGKSVILVTHKLREVMASSQRVSVLRAGKVVGEFCTKDTNAQELANAMVGRKLAVQNQVPAGKKRRQVALEVSGLRLEGPVGGRRRLDNISFQVNQGEVVGIAGVEGNGQTELVEALLHPREPACLSAGRVSISGQDVTRWNARRIRELVAVIPQDRVLEGLLPERPLTENLLLGKERRREWVRGGFISQARVRANAALALQQFDVRPPVLDLPAKNLSGGNQQKLIFARELQHTEQEPGLGPRLILAAQPTRGVDVSVLDMIHRRLLELRDSGCGLLLISSDLEEVLKLSDRVLVMFEGRIVAEYPKGGVSERELGLRMGGAR